MKFSTKKERLKYADSVLAIIRENIKTKRVNEIDWEEHRAWARGVPQYHPIPFSRPEDYARMPDIVRQEKLKQIEDKYSKLPPTLESAEQKEREIDEMLKEIEIVRQHIMQRRVEIPEDPAKQTELQKVLVNHPIMTSKEIYEKAISADKNSFHYKDPVTGLLWNYNVGSPEPGEEWRVAYEKHLRDSGEMLELIKQAVDMKVSQRQPILGTPEWDHSRGWLWNIWRQMTGGFGDFSSQ